MGAAIAQSAPKIFVSAGGVNCGDLSVNLSSPMKLAQTRMFKAAVNDAAGTRHAPNLSLVVSEAKVPSLEQARLIGGQLSSFLIGAAKHSPFLLSSDLTPTNQEKVLSRGGLDFNVNVERVKHLDKKNENDFVYELLAPLFGNKALRGSTNWALSHYGFFYAMQSMLILPSVASLISNTNLSVSEIAAAGVATVFQLSERYYAKSRIKNPVTFTIRYAGEILVRLSMAFKGGSAIEPESTFYTRHSKVDGGYLRGALPGMPLENRVDNPYLGEAYTLEGVDPNEIA